jgi:hypothetical protein
MVPTSHETEYGPLYRQLNGTRDLITSVWRKFRIFSVKTGGTYKKTGLERLINYFFKYNFPIIGMQKELPVN